MAKFVINWTEWLEFAGSYFYLRFDCHAKEVVRACNYHTRALRHLCTLLTDDLAQIAACSIVGSRLDYCNAMLYGAPTATFNVLQRAQNNLARVVCQRGGRTDARPLLRSLHWLPSSDIGLQDGGADVQDDGLLNASVFE